MKYILPIVLMVSISQALSAQESTPLKNSIPLYLDMNFFNVGLGTAYQISDRSVFNAGTGIGITTFINEVSMPNRNGYYPNHPDLRIYIAPYVKLGYAYTFAYHNTRNAYAESHSFIKLQANAYFASIFNDVNKFNYATLRTKLVYGLGAYINKAQTWAYSIEVGGNLFSKMDYSNLYLLPAVNFNVRYYIIK